MPYKVLHTNILVIYRISGILNIWLLKELQIQNNYDKEFSCSSYIYNSKYNTGLIMPVLDYLLHLQEPQGSYTNKNG